MVKCTTKYLSIVLLFLVSCTTSLDEQVEPKNLKLSSTQSSFIIDEIRINSSFSNFTLDVIIEYSSHVAVSDYYKLRQKHGVTAYKTCNCSETKFELWTIPIDPSGGIEGGLRGLKSDSGLETVNQNHSVSNTPPITTSFANIGTQIKSKIVSNNDGVTIAIVDTGIDPYFHQFDTQFLYDFQHPNIEKSPYNYGWNSIDNNAFPFDENGHGTIVASLIKQQLNGVNYQIFPIKAFNSEGKGHYFDILCGVNLALENSDVDIINMSFGWSVDKFELLEKIILRNTNKVFFTSAGNSGLSNDRNKHYPSNYDARNLYAVGSISGNNVVNKGLAPFSNYGKSTVDIAAPGENLSFYYSKNNYFPISGTSYSSAIAAGNFAKQLSTSRSSSEAIQKFENSLVHLPNLSNTRTTSAIMTY